MIETGGGRRGRTESTRPLIDPAPVGEPPVDEPPHRPARGSDDGGAAAEFPDQVAKPLPAAGVALARVLAAVVPERLDGYDLLEVIAATGRLSSWVDAVQLTALAELGRRRPDVRAGWRRESADPAEPVSEFAADEVAVALHTSRLSAGARLDVAVRLAGDLPDTLGALAAGRLPTVNARILADETLVLSSAGPAGVAAVARVEQAMLPHAEQDTPGRFRARVRRAVLAADPKAAAARERAARKGRLVELCPVEDGMAWLSALLPAPEAVAVHGRLSDLAHALPAEDPRGMDARRADILVDLLLDQPDPASPTTTTGDGARGQDQPNPARPGLGLGPSSDSGSGGGSGPAEGGARSRAGSATRPGRRAAIHVTVPLDTLTGRADLPGQLAGYGPITAQTARALAGIPGTAPASTGHDGEPQDADAPGPAAPTARHTGQGHAAGDEPSEPAVGGAGSVANAPGTADRGGAEPGGSGRGRPEPHRPQPAGDDRAGPDPGAAPPPTGPGHRAGPDQGAAPPPTQPGHRADPDPLGGSSGWDPRWRRLLCDPLSGTLLDVARRTYRPPVGLDEHVALRDGTCRFPGCRRAALRCDRDHVVPFPDGPTAATNLISLCRHHHRLKHEAGWQVRLDGHTGRLTWTTPTGHAYLTTPEPLTLADHGAPEPAEPPATAPAPAPDNDPAF